jgi:hypothetical protein
VPRHLLPAAITPEEWEKLKPDGLMTWTDDKSGARHVVVIELKVTRDVDPACALAAAESQHARLLDLLRAPADGAPSAPPVLATIALGATGVVFQGGRAALTEHLGVSFARADALLENMALALARSTHAIIRTRRRFEALAHAHAQPHDRAPAPAGGGRKRTRAEAT